MYVERPPTSHPELLLSAVAGAERTAYLFMTMATKEPGHTHSSETVQTQRSDRTGRPRTAGARHFPSVALVPLGCAKAQVDAEEMLGALEVNGYRIVADPRQADAVIVNTCGFIDPAKEESIEAILDATTLKERYGVRAVVATGCLVQRYPKELRDGLPEADLFIPWSEERQLVARLDQLFGIDRGTPAERGRRTLISPRHWAYVRISEGCDHRCAFCTIPGIRGRHASVPPEVVAGEVRRLVELGVQEFNLVGQDTTLYGVDLFGRPSLPRLLRELVAVPGVRWIRVFYAHPAHVDDDLIDTMAEHEAIVPYLDVPIQHINDVLLKRMRRIVGRRRIEELIARLRERIPDITLRTSIIVGMPYETEKRFQELVDFLPQARFDRLGCFTYSKEEGTLAAAMGGQVPERVREERRAIVMDVQREISRTQNERRIGKRYDVLVERSVRTNGSAGGVGRSVCEAPEVDGEIHVRAPKPLEAGAWVRARITDADEHDLTAVAVGEG